MHVETLTRACLDVSHVYACTPRRLVTEFTHKYRRTNWHTYIGIYIHTQAYIHAGDTTYTIYLPPEVQNARMLFQHLQVYYVYITHTCTRVSVSKVHMIPHAVCMCVRAYMHTYTTHTRTQALCPHISYAILEIYETPETAVDGPEIKMLISKKSILETRESLIFGIAAAATTHVERSVICRENRTQCKLVGENYEHERIACLRCNLR